VFSGSTQPVGMACFFRGRIWGRQQDREVVLVADEAKKHELAESDYMSGMKYKEIAEKYGVSLATVKSWKTRYRWSREGMRANPKKGMHTKSQKSMHTKKAAKASGEGISAGEIEEILGNAELTDKQRLFCIYYIRCFNATKAYQKAYNAKYETAATLGYRMLKNDSVRGEIDRLKKNRLNREMLTEEDIVQMYIDILYADICDYVDTKHNMIDLNGPLVDGRLIKKVSFGKTDSIELLDKGSALKWLSEHMNLATEKQKAEIDLLKAKLIKENGSEEETEDDGFIEALQATAKEDWENEEN